MNNPKKQTELFTVFININIIIIMNSLACLDTQSLTSLGTLTTACSSSPSPALPTMDLIQVMVIINKITIIMMMTMIGADGATDEPQIVTICPEHLLSLTRPTDVMMMMMMTRLVIMVMMMKMMMDIIIS